MVRRKTVKTPGANRWEPTRRELLGAAAAATFGLMPAAGIGSGQHAQPTATRTQPATQLEMPPWVRVDKAQSRVVDVRSAKVAGLQAVDSEALGEMLDQGIQSLTAATTPAAGWRSVLGSVERVLIKFNSVGDRILRVNEALARLLVDRLGTAGYAPEGVALVEAPGFLRGQLGTAQVTSGWGGEIEVGGRPEQLARYLFEADAIINVPLLKTHQLAGMSGCLKNLSHALIRHPADFHANGCSPYVGQVVNSQEVSSRLQLNVMNAVRIVVDRGPDARPEDIVGYGGLLLGLDPLAVDNVGLSILSVERRRLGLSGGLDVRYLASAAELGLGRWRPADIDRIAVEIDG
jgi:hypothetical protein